MTDVSLDELGPIDYLVVEFPAGAANFTGEMVTELLSLVDRGIIRVVDVLILTKDADGSVEALELSDVGEVAGRVDRLPAAHLARGVVLELLELPHARVLLLPLLAGVVGESAEQLVGAGIDDVAARGVLAHDREDVGVNAELQLTGSRVA